MVYLSKSKYCGLWQCAKIAWLKKYKPEEFFIDDSVQARMDAGNMVGDLAMGLFGDFVEVTEYGSDGKIDLNKMMARTREEMQKGTQSICEASFEYNGLYCAVDILRKEDGGWAIYEVKSSTKHVDDYGNVTDDKQVYIADISYQKYVLEHCGVNVTGTYLVCLNGDYVFDGTLDLNQLFFISDVADSVATEIRSIETNVAIAERILNSEEEPDIDLSVSCNKPYKCAFWQYCSRNIPEESVFQLYRLWFSKKIDYYRKGWIGYRDLLDNAEIKNEKQLRQMEYALSDKGTYVDREGVRDFLSTLSYPLYFLDFETMQPAVPLYAGTRPYMQIPFQYSLHYIDTEGGTLKHKEFLAESGPDPRRALAEQLCRDIPMNVCVTAYNKAFECTRLKELAAAFPDLAEHLLNIRDNIKDLLVPFQSGYYYNRAMGGSFSIKSVLPAIFPDDPGLNYHIKHVQRCLRAGFTTLRDSGGQPFVCARVKEAIDKGEIEGPNMTVCGRLMSPTELGNNANPFVESTIHEVDTLDSIRKGVREEIRDGADYIKYVASGAISLKGSDPFVPIATEEEIRTLVKEAAFKGRYVAAHVHGTESIKQCIRAGVKTLEHASCLDDECIEMLKEKTSYIIGTVELYGSMLGGAEVPEYAKNLGSPAANKVRDDAIKWLKIADEAGLIIGFGTDSGMVNLFHGENAKGIVYYVKLCGLKETQALKHATIDSAEILGEKDKRGSVKAGKIADLIVVDGDPTQDINRIADGVVMVIKSGKIVCDVRQ